MLRGMKICKGSKLLLQGANFAGEGSRPLGCDEIDVHRIDAVRNMESEVHKAMAQCKSEGFLSIVKCAHVNVAPWVHDERFLNISWEAVVEVHGMSENVKSNPLEDEA